MFNISTSRRVRVKIDMERYEFVDHFSVSQQIPVFKLTFEKKLKTKHLKKSTYAIDVRSCGLCIVCCPEFLERLHNFYKSTIVHSFQSLSSFVYNWKRIKHCAVNNFISLLESIIPASNINTNKIDLQNVSGNQYREKRKIIHVHIDMSAAKIIIPAQSLDAIVIDLGCVTLNNNFQTNNNFVISPVTSEISQEQFQENDDVFLTPISSPPPIDASLEMENTFYSINIILNDDYIEASSFTLSVHDIQVEYSMDQSQLLEKFSVYFVIQHSLKQLWPLKKISATLQKMNLDLDSQKIPFLHCSINSWITLIDKIVDRSNYQSVIWPMFDIHFDEISIRLKNDVEVLCNIHLENIELDNDSSKLSLNIQNIILYDCIERCENDKDILLKTNQYSNRNEPFIRINIEKSFICETNLSIDINSDTLYCMLNPKTICTLDNFLFDIELFDSCRANFVSCTNFKIRKINGKFRNIDIYVVNLMSTMLQIEIHGENISLNTILNPLSTLDLTIRTIQISHILNNSINPSITDDEQRNIIIDLGTQSTNHELSQEMALNLLSLTKNTTNNEFKLSMKMTSIYCFHLVNIVDNMEQIVQYMIQNCQLISKLRWETNNESILYFHELVKSSEKSIISCIFDIDLQAIIIVFPIDNDNCFSPMDNVIKFDRIRIRNDYDQLSDYKIHINRIGILLKNSIFSIEHVYWQLFESIFICLNFQLSDKLIWIDLKLISPLQIYLSQKRIKFLCEIFKIISIHDRKLSLPFQSDFHIHSSQIFVNFQTDHNNHLITICQGNIDQCRIFYEYHSRRISLQFNSLQIKDRVKNFNQNLLTLKYSSLIEFTNDKQFNIKLSHIDIQLLQSIWIILIEMIEIYDNEIYSLRIANGKKINIYIKPMITMFFLHLRNSRKDEASSTIQF